jgi:GAF domain-containing protein/predicted Ser/Thr protein kinase
VSLSRDAVWHADAETRAYWASIHVGPLLQMIAFIGCAAILLALRPRGPTARLAIAALIWSGVGTIGPLNGAEAALPPGLRQVMTMFVWMALPFAFPTIALAIEYFPRRSDLLNARPWLHVVPYVVALPLIIPALLTGLFVCGVDSLAGAAAWDAAHPALFFGTFAAGLAINIGAMLEGVFRYKRNADPQERRRLAVAVLTLFIGTLAFTIRDGIPVLTAALGGTRFTWPWWFTLPLCLLVSLPAIGVTYAVAVHRVMSPRLALRRSVQYALAQKTLAAVAILPGVLMIVSLIKQRDQSLAAIVSGQPVLYGALFVISLVALRFREKARVWLDRQFFRTEYNAQAVLVSLAGRIPFETDPNELTALVLDHIDRALKPSMAAVLVSGLEPTMLMPVAVLRGSADPLAAQGGIATMLEWSDEPLELYLDDTRSPARRLPPDEIAWLERTGAVLFVPLYSKDQTTRVLLGTIALGAKRSEEPYLKEDRELLAAIAGQVSLGLDVARLRRTERAARADEEMTGTGNVLSGLLTECPTCRVCYETGTQTCPTDNSPLETGALPNVVDGKYRIDRVLGYGGMGSVYRAHDMRLDRDVAIKVVKGHLLSDPEARARFRREAQLVARLQHPGIVSVFDYGTVQDGAAFLVMEFVRGRDLRSVVRDGALSAADVARLLAAIAAPVDAAHRQGVLHRDLKPENILLPDHGVPAKVLDFGIAKVLAGSATATGVTGSGHPTTLTALGQPLGTPAYMAPEQFAGEEMTPRTDVFALGVIGYELLTGALPFGRGSFIDVAMRQRQGPAPLTLTGVPDQLRSAILDALALDPDQRPASAAAFAERVVN